MTEPDNPTCPRPGKHPEAMTVEWNPRFRAYAKSQGCDDPSDVLKLDDERWPGGVMTGFTLWIQDQWAAWRKERGYSLRKMPILSEEHHMDFDQWLQKSAAKKS